MTMNPLPPQAYTKDTLTKAYMWLAHQNASIKELATTPDILVSLFLKAQRNGEEALDTPSIQNFKNELKSLAGLMGELEPKVHNSQPTHVPPVHVHQHPIPQPQVQTAHVQVQPTQVQAKQVNIQNNHISVDLTAHLDARSKAMVSEVRDQLNLSTDLEAIRLLVSLGYNKAKNLYS